MAQKEINKQTAAEMAAVDGVTLDQALQLTQAILSQQAWTDAHRAVEDPEVTYARQSLAVQPTAKP